MSSNYNKNKYVLLGGLLLVNQLPKIKVFQDVLPGTWINNAADDAFRNGYEFFLFNDKVFYISCDGDIVATEARKDLLY